MYKAKILIVGPPKSGKSVIANILAEATDVSSGDYHPTQGCRILEFEPQGVSIDGKNIKPEIELWDCSGDHKFETCWPAMAKDTSGVIFIFNPEESNGQDLDSWCNYFVEHQGLRESQCVVFEHRKSGNDIGHRTTLNGQVSELNMVRTSLDDDGEVLKREFNAYLCTLFSEMSAKHEQDELTILNYR